MDEDESVVLRNTGLRLHLREAGFEDFEVIDENGHTTTASQIHENLSKPEKDYAEFEKLIGMILESHIVFHDDVLFVQNLAVHMRPIHTARSFNIVYANVAIQTVAVSTGCLACSACGIKIKPRLYIPLHLIPLSFYAVKQFYMAYHKRTRRKKIEKLLENAIKLSMLMQRTIQFVYESEVLTYSNPLLQPKQLPGMSKVYIGEWQAMQHLRLSIFHAIRSGILDLKWMIIILVKNFKLKSHVSSASYYLAFLEEVDLQCSLPSEAIVSIKQLQNMKYVYLLLQSEFLRQLSLCFIPSLWVCNTTGFLRNTFMLLNDFNIQCATRYQQLKAIFDVYYACDKPYRKDLMKSSNHRWMYRDAYVKLTSVSLNLQTILKNCRILEEFIEETRTTKTIPDDFLFHLDNFSEYIVCDYERTKVIVDDFHKYVLSLKPKIKQPSPTTQESSKDKSSSIKTNVVVGITDFNPEWPDEVFVGVAEKDHTITESEAVSNEGIVNCACSKTLINELKVALQSKAKEWKQREKIALQTRKMEIEDEELADVKKHNSEGSSSDEELRVLSIQSIFDKTQEYKFKPISADETSFAKEIRKASAAWPVRNEEFIGDNGGDE